MKISQTLLSLLVIGIAGTLASVSSRGAPAAENRTSLSEYSFRSADADSSALAVKLKEILSRLCLAVERAYQEVGLTSDDVNAVLAVQAPPQRLWQPYQQAWPAVLKARTAAVEELAALGADAVPLLLKAKDESLGGAHRDLFVKALEKISKPAVPALLEGLSVPDAPVRSRAITALARIGYPRAVKAVIPLLDEPDQQVVGTAVWALGLLKDQTAVEPLLRVWNKGLWRASVATALGFQQDRRAVHPLMAGLESCLAEAQRTGNWDNEYNLMQACIMALGHLGDRQAIPVLETALQAGPQRTKKTSEHGQTYLVAEAAAGVLRTFGFHIDGDRVKGGYKITAVPSREAPAGKPTALSELSGIFHTDELTIMPYLILDGSEERCYLRGSALAAHPSGTHLQVKGTLGSELFDATGTDWTTGALAPPPFLKGWVVCMAVEEAKVATEPFVHSAEVSLLQAKDPDLQAPYRLRCAILSDDIPNPLILRITNPLDTEVRLSTFMSTHTTMGPMPNVRLAITDTATRQTQYYTPVNLTQTRKGFIIAPGESRDFPVYHHGLKLTPGTYELTVSLFDDADIQQKAPIANSSMLCVRNLHREPRPENLGTDRRTSG